MSQNDESKGIVVSLYDYSGRMVEPWAKNGYECYCLDIKHNKRYTENVVSGNITYIPADLRKDKPSDLIPDKQIAIIFAFPPCKNLAVSGARWFKEKGLSGLADGIQLVETATKFCGKYNAPYMIENPVSTLSTYWRKPDYTFHPYEYDGFVKDDEAYSKKTCLWVGNGFNMPQKSPAEEYDDRIHKMPPSEDRSEKRSMTPKGFAKAVYYENSIHSSND